MVTGAAAVATPPTLSVAVNVYEPARLILQPANVATPEDAVPLSPPALVHVMTPAPPVIESVTVLASVVTVLLPRSCTVTIGWVAKFTVAAAPTGAVVKATFAAIPTVITTLPVVAEVSVPSEACSVYGPTVSSFHALTRHAC